MGRPEFESTVTNAPKEVLISLNDTKFVSLGVGASEVVEFYGDPNTINEVVTMEVYCRDIDAAATGDHAMDIFYKGSGAREITIMSVRKVANSSLHYQCGQWNGSTFVTCTPEDKASQTSIVSSLKFDSTKGIGFRYTNNSNLATIKERSIDIACVRREIS